MANVLLGWDNKADDVTLEGGSWSASMPLSKLTNDDTQDVARSSSCKRAHTTMRGRWSAAHMLRCLLFRNHNMDERNRWRLRVGRASFDLLFDDEDGDINDTRLTKSGGTNGTRVNKNGYIVPVTCTNTALQSQTLTVTWTVTGITRTADAATSPENTVTSDKLDEGTGSSAHTLTQTFSATSGTTYAYSFHVKDGDRRYVQLSFATASHGANAWANFDLQEGEIGEVGSALLRAAIEPAGAGHWRILIVAPATATTASGSIDLSLVTSASAARAESYTGTSKYVYAWGAQLEQGGDWTPYIVTTTVAETVTRSGRIQYGTFRTNELKHSNGFRRSDWTKTRATVSENEATDPNGTGTAWKLVEDATATNTHFIEQTVTAISGASYTFSAYFMAGERTFGSLRFAGAAWGSDKSAFYNLSTGATATVEAGLTATISAVGGGWYRCTATTTASAATTGTVRIHVASADATQSYTGNGTSGIYIWSAQLERVSSVTAYIATTFWARSVVDSTADGLLDEEARTNAFVRSGELDNASWSKGAGVAAAGNTTEVVAPDGTINADKVTISGIDNGLYQTVTVTANTAYTFSVYVRMGTLATGDYKIAFYDATAGAFIASDIVPTGTTAGAGFTRYAYTVTTPVGCVSMRAYVFRNAAVSAGTFYAFGAQLEIGVTATSYIQTAGSTVARTADSITVTGSNFTGWFTSAWAYTIYVKGRVPATTTDATSRVIVSIGDSSTFNESVYISRQAASASIAGSVVDGGSGLWGSPSLGNATAGTFFHAAIAVEANNLSGCFNGGAINQDTAATMPTVNSMTIGNGSWSGASSHINDCVQRVTVLPEALNHADLRAITTSGPDAIGYNSGWVDALQFTFDGDTPSDWGEDYDLPAAFDETQAKYFTAEFDALYNSAATLDLGRLAATRGFQSARNMSREGISDSDIDLDDVVTTDSGRRTGTTRGYQGRSALVLPWLTQAEANVIRELRRHVRRLGEVVYISDPDDMAQSQRDGGLCHLEELDATQYPYVLTRSTAFRVLRKK
jgi:hypothetical protein